MIHLGNGGDEVVDVMTESRTQESAQMEGIRELARGNVAGALEAFVRALAGSEEPCTRALCRARLLYLRGQESRAADLLVELLAWEPDNAEAHYLLAQVHESAHRTLDAIACYRRALAIAPSDPRFRHSLARLTDIQEP